MAEISKLIVSYGFAAVIVAYFIWKDFKFNNQILQVLTELRIVMSFLSGKGE